MFDKFACVNIELCQAKKPSSLNRMAFSFGEAMMLFNFLVIDNYDSFTFNLVQMFRQYPLNIRIYRSDDITMEQAFEFSPDYIVISPGPKDPANAGISVELIRTFYKTVPILGVCLGMQCMNEAFGGQTIRAPLPMHGKVSWIHHGSEGIFKSMPTPFLAARYHSLMVKFGKTPLKVTATSDDGVVMGMFHPKYPMHGVQFHPESFLTQHGFVMVENFLKTGLLKDPKQISTIQEYPSWKNL
jgi:anthranilate synthase component II